MNQGRLTVENMTVASRKEKPLERTLGADSQVSAISSVKRTRFALTLPVQLEAIVYLGRLPRR
jgi:hypothetical protein